MKENLKKIVLNQFDIFGKKINIDLSELDKLNNVEELFIKNFKIDNEIFSKISKIEKIYKLVFINCIIDGNFEIKNVESIKFDNCKNIHNCILGKQIKRLYVEDCDYIDLKDIENLNLNTFKIKNTLAKSLGKISNMENLEYIYLNEIYIKENIDYSIFKKLKVLNLNGSYVDDKEKYLEQFENCNFSFSFMDENLLI